MVEEIKEDKKVGSVSPRIKTSKGSSSKLHPREVTLIRRLWFEGWTDYQIWKEYRIPFPVIQKAKNEIERQAKKEFENKKLHAVELARLKHLLKVVIDSNDAITKDPNVSHADRLKSEAIKLEALALLHVAIIASITSPDPHSTLGKIIEQDSRRVSSSNTKESFLGTTNGARTTEPATKLSLYFVSILS